VVRVRFDCGFLKDSVYIQDMQLEIPNLVTQNGDGQNDVFQIKKTGEEAGWMEVYNNWGSLIFTSKEYQNDWPEEDLDGGLYYYHYTINTCSRKGWVQVVK
jgi:gliding motility-associated-like protein